MMRMMHGQSGMSMGVAMGPGMVLGLQESLDLTDGQITELETLRGTVRSTVQQHMMQGMQVMRAASDLLSSDSPDLDMMDPSGGGGTGG